MSAALAYATDYAAAPAALQADSAPRLVVIKHGEAPVPLARALAQRQRDPWAEATSAARQVAQQREVIVNDLLRLRREGITQNAAIALLLERAAHGLLSAALSAALSATAKSGRPAPTRATLCDWLARYREGGVAALLPQHKGRIPASPSWWGPAIEYFNSTSGADIAAVHRRLLEVDGYACTYEQVRAYLNGIPAMLGRNSPARIGRRLYRLSQKAWVKRSTLRALPGDCYVADGYRADVYLAHPITGDIWRPELTVAIDLRSRFIAGWRADAHEGTYAVQGMWAETFARWSHVPPFLYIDNGSGYKNKLMDGMVGFYARAGVQEIIHALPSNPHGKGWVERFFRTLKDDFLRLWRPEFYCGSGAAAENLNMVVRECKAGRLKPPSLAEFSDALNDWLARYHARPHPENREETPAAVWARLQPIAPAASVLELKYEAVTLTVRRAGIQKDARIYRHPDLLAFNGKKVSLEYSLTDDSAAVVRTLEGRWICNAHLVSSIDAIAPDRLSERRLQASRDAVKRLERKANEQRERAGITIDAEAVAVSAREALPTDGTESDGNFDLLELNRRSA